MDIKYKLYPHPVLTSTTDDYVGSTFNCKLDYKNGINEVIFNFEIEFDNDEILSLIENGKAEYLVHIECPKTFFRYTIKTTENKFNKSIADSKLNGKVNFCIFVVAKQDLTGYTNKNFNRDYCGMSFDIDKGSIMAIGGQYDCNIEKNSEELSKVQSIFTICRYQADNQNGMEIDIEGDKIAIKLSNESFQNYKLLSNMPTLQPVFHSMIVIPALIYTFETLKREQIESYDNRRWLSAIRRTLKKRNIELTDQLLESTPSYEIAQKLLDLPIDRGLTAITNINNDGEE